MFAFVAKRNGRDRPATDTPSSNVLITTRCRPSRPAAHQNSAGHLHPYQDRRCIGSALGCSTVGPLNSTIIVHNSQFTGWRHSNLIITTLLNCHTLHCAARACTRVSSLSLPPSLPPSLSLSLCEIVVWIMICLHDTCNGHIKTTAQVLFFFFWLTCASAFSEILLCSTCRHGLRQTLQEMHEALSTLHFGFQLARNPWQQSTCTFL